MNTTMKLKPVIFCLVTFIVSCNQLNFTQPGDKYYYYPSKNVYYDVSRSTFIYSLDSGKTWDSIYLESAEPAIFGAKQTVYNTSGEVWKDNEAHREMYNGTLLNIVNEESLKVPEPPAEKRTARKSTSTQEEPEKKERKRPIKKFFQKLFGKKD